MTLFDPETGKVRDLEALRSLQFRASGFRRPQHTVRDGKKVTEIVNEFDGSSAGFNAEHSDGRVDATVTPKAAVATAGM